MIITEVVAYEIVKTKEIRKEAAELFAHAGDGHRADAGDEPDGAGENVFK